MWVWWAGCAWIPVIEHRENRKLLDADADADADADTDADTDADSDADTDTDTCVDDGLEPNDSLLTATEAPLPALFESVLCPQNVSPTVGVPLDLYRAELAAGTVLEVEIDERAGFDCGEQSLRIEVWDDAGVTWPGAVAEGGCPELELGWGAGAYYVAVLGDVSDPEQPYALRLGSHVCNDGDGDTFLSDSCGGPDCDDTRPDEYPGGEEPPILDGIDQDCDGGDDLYETCTAVLSGATLVDETLTCSDPATGAAWDRWTIPGPSTSGVSVVVQNAGVGGADPMALLVDADGTTHFGLEPDRSQLDDDVDCAAPAWTGQATACPGACVFTASPGQPMTVWVAQHPGAGCVEGAEYQLLVYVDGLAVVPLFVDDDVPLAFP